MSARTSFYAIAFSPARRSFMAQHRRCVFFSIALLSYAHMVPGSRLADYVRLDESSEHADVFYLGPNDVGVRSFFLDAELVVTKSVLSWLQVARRKWKGFMNEGDHSAVSMTITGTPKVCLASAPCATCSRGSLFSADGKVTVAQQSPSRSDCCR
jgi:hypothetical protein